MLVLAPRTSLAFSTAVVYLIFHVRRRLSQTASSGAHVCCALALPFKAVARDTRNAYNTRFSACLVLDTFAIPGDRFLLNWEARDHESAFIASTRVVVDVLR